MYQRRSIRLREYDYTQNGAYFVTICAYKHICALGQTIDDGMVLSECGQVVQACWNNIPVHFPMVELDAFVVMPNHVHGVIVITETVGEECIVPVNNEASAGPSVGATHGSPLRPNGPKRNSLGAIIGQFKAAVTRRINRLPSPPDHPIWQRNYYEHIIRNEESLNMIRHYIVNNPTKWTEDSLYKR